MDRICRAWRLPDTLFHQVQTGHQPVSSVGCRWGHKLIIFLVLINPKILSRFFMAIQTNNVQKHGEQPCWGSPCSITHNGSKTGPWDGERRIAHQPSNGWAIKTYVKPIWRIQPDAFYWLRWIPETIFEYIMVRILVEGQHELDADGKNMTLLKPLRFPANIINSTSETIRFCQQNPSFF